MPNAPAFARLRSSAIILFSGNVVETLAAFGAQIVIARYLFPEDFGRFAIAFANTSLVFIVLNLRIQTLILRRPDGEFTREVRERYFFAFTAESIVGAAVTLTIIQWFYGLTILDVILIVALALSHWVETDRIFYERQMNYRKLVPVEVASRLAGHAVAVIMVAFGAGVMILFLREFLVAFIRLLGFRAVGALTIERLRWLSWQEWRFLFAESRALWADSILEGSFQRIVVLLSGALGGAQGAGLFFFAHRLANVPHQLLMPITGRLSSNWLSRQEDPARRRQNFGRLSSAVLAFSALTTAAAIVFADPVIPWLFGEPWRDTVPVFIALAGMILFSILFEVIKVYCYVEGAGAAILGSRSSKFVVLAFVAGFAYQAGVAPAESMGMGMSAAFAFACGIAWIMLRHRARAGRQR